MSSIAVLGATGSLGSHVARQALAAGHDLSVMVRTPARLDAELAAKARVEVADLAAAPLDLLSRFADGQQALICCAGVVTEGPKFVALIERIIEAVEAVPAQRRPPCWFMAGAALLDLDAKGRRGVDLPKVRDTYWRHRVNFERLRRSSLDSRLLCPGPMVEQPALGLARLRLSVDVLPAPLPPLARHVPTPRPACWPTRRPAGRWRSGVSGLRCPRACEGARTSGRPSRRPLKKLLRRPE